MDWTRVEVGRPFGIPVQLHFTLLLVVVFFGWIMGRQLQESPQFLSALPLLQVTESMTVGAAPFVIGGIIAVALFASILAHELGHALVARRFDVEIMSITLWFIGGVARMKDLPRKPQAELYIAVAGPAVSVAVGLAMIALGLVAPGAPVRFILAYTGLLNIFLAVFNLLPAFPMDGGRILRSAMAWRGVPYLRATEIASSAGRLFALVFAAIAVLDFNIFLLAIAFFVYIGAGGEARQVAMRDALSGVHVAQIMSGQVETVTPDMDVETLTQRMLNSRHTGFPVVEDDRLYGIVTLTDVKTEETPREARVETIMTPRVVTVAPGASAGAVLALLGEHEIGRVIVTADGSQHGMVVGIVTRSDVMRALRILEAREHLLEFEQEAGAGEGAALEETPATLNEPATLDESTAVDEDETA